MKRVFFSLLSVSLLMASPSHAFGRKYSQVQVAPDVFVVTIVGTKTTTYEKALSGLLTRASELTLAHGYKYFTVAASANQTKTSTVSCGQEYFSGSLVPSSIINLFGNNLYGMSSSVAYAYTMTELGGCMTIKCYKEKPEIEGVVDADFFLETKKSART